MALPGCSRGLLGQGWGWGPLDTRVSIRRLAHEKRLIYLLKARGVCAVVVVWCVLCACQHQIFCAHYFDLQVQYCVSGNQLSAPLKICVKMPDKGSQCPSSPWGSCIIYIGRHEHCCPCRCCCLCCVFVCWCCRGSHWLPSRGFSSDSCIYISYLVRLYAVSTGMSSTQR